MKERMRLVDCQVHMSPSSSIPADELRTIQQSFFTVYETIRLWFKARQIRAPFRKLAVTLAAGDRAAQWHGHTMLALSICDVTEAVDTNAVRQRANDHVWVLGIVQHALTCVEKALDWRSEELESFIEELKTRSLPLVHVFDKLARTDRRSGTVCQLWFSVRPGETTIGARIGERDVEVICMRYPHPSLYLEDEFPVAKAAIRDRVYTLLDRKGTVLARVSIDDPTLLEFTPPPKPWLRQGAV